MGVLSRIMITEHKRFFGEKIIFEVELTGD